MFGVKKNILPFCPQRGAPCIQQTSQEKHGRSSTRSEQTRSAGGQGEGRAKAADFKENTPGHTQCRPANAAFPFILPQRGEGDQPAPKSRREGTRRSLKAGSGQDQACLQGRLRRRGDITAAALLALWMGVKSADGEKRTTAETLEREEKNSRNLPRGMRQRARTRPHHRRLGTTLCSTRGKPTRDAWRAIARAANEPRLGGLRLSHRPRAGEGSTWSTSLLRSTATLLTCQHRRSPLWPNQARSPRHALRSLRLSHARLEK